ncbi:unnamed protein product, partial [Dibothriocephalus latus]
MSVPSVASFSLVFAPIKTTLGGSAATKRLERLKRLAEVESTRSLDEEEDNEEVSEPPVNQGFRKASAMFLRGAFPRYQKHVQMRRATQAHVAAERRLSRADDDVQHSKRSSG